MGDLFASWDVNTVLTYSTALAIILGSRVVSPIVARIIIYIFHKILKVRKKVTESGFYEPLKFFFTVIGFGIAIYYLKLPEGVINLYNRIFKILLILTIAKAFSNCLEPDSTFFNKLESTPKFNGNEALNTFLGNVLRVIVYTVAAFMIIHDLGYDLGGLATGLGLGSAVVALAAQDFVKSLIGGFAIITDKPFEIGDFIEIGDYIGIVTEISFRSTRIKGIDKTIISIPNSVIVTAYVKNWSRLENRMISMDLRLDLNANTATINNAISKIKTILKSDEDVLSESVSVHLTAINSDANIVSVFAYVDTTNYGKYLEIKEKINCEILTALESENIELVYPTQKVYMKSI